jgi:hypothetical protein
MPQVTAVDEQFGTHTMPFQESSASPCCRTTSSRFPTASVARYVLLYIDVIL